MRNILFTAALFLLVGTTAQAIEPKNPSTICDRFAADADKSACEQKMKKDSPDWYLAGVCSKQFDDKSFYECLDLGKNAQFSPLKIHNCDNTTASDETRLNCLKEIAEVGAIKDQYQGRKPAQDDRWKNEGYGKTRLAR